MLPNFKKKSLRNLLYVLLCATFCCTTPLHADAQRYTHVAQEFFKARFKSSFDNAYWLQQGIKRPDDYSGFGVGCFVVNRNAKVPDANFPGWFDADQNQYKQELMKALVSHYDFIDTSANPTDTRTVDNDILISLASLFGLNSSEKSTLKITVSPFKASVYYLDKDAIKRNRGYFTQETLDRFNSGFPHPGRKRQNFIVQSELVITNLHLTVNVDTVTAQGIRAKAKILARIPTQDVKDGSFDFHVGGGSNLQGLFELKCDGDCVVAQQVVPVTAFLSERWTKVHDKDEWKPRILSAPLIPLDGSGTPPRLIHWFPCESDYQDIVSRLNVQPLTKTGYKSGVHGMAFDRPQLLVWPGRESGDLNASGAVTLSAWIHDDPNGMISDGMILSKGYDNTINYSVGVYAKRVLLKYTDSNNSIYNLYTEELFPTDGRWHHLSGVIDTKRKSMEIYIDGKKTQTSIDVFGVPYSTRDAALKAMQPMTPNSEPLTIGFAYHENGESPRSYIHADPTLFWPGLMDEIMIFDQALTPLQIQALYNSTK